MKNALNILIFTLLITLMYWYVGQWVPQKEAHPPEKIDLSGDLSTAQLVDVGQQIFDGARGTCVNCHTTDGTTGGRFPDLGGIGALAADRIDGYTDVEYLAESLYDPNIFIVEGFAGGMPVINKPPIGLSDREILAVIAYLQSLGGTPSVTLDTEFRWQTGDDGGSAPAQASTTASSEKLDGPAVFEKYACQTCHSIDSDDPLVGPGLASVGSRLSKAELYESILDPDATITEGFFAGVMSVSVNADNMTPAELKTLVDYLASMRGN